MPGAMPAAPAGVSTMCYPIFKKSEGSDRGDSHWHGADGPLKVSRGRPSLDIADRFLDAAVEDGFDILSRFQRRRARGLRPLRLHYRSRPALQQRNRFSSSAL